MTAPSNAGPTDCEYFHSVPVVYSITFGFHFSFLNFNSSSLRFTFKIPFSVSISIVSPFFKFDGQFNREKIGGMPTELIVHFFYTLSQNLKANIHIDVTGEDDHHKAESCFKCFGRAFSQAIKKSSVSGVPSTKGTL